jgi:hypothetical protein
MPPLTNGGVKKVEPGGGINTEAVAMTYPYTIFRSSNPDGPACLPSLTQQPTLYVPDAVGVQLHVLEEDQSRTTTQAPLPACNQNLYRIGSLSGSLAEHVHVTVVPTTCGDALSGVRPEIVGGSLGGADVIT